MCAVQRDLRGWVKGAGHFMVFQRANAMDGNENPRVAFCLLHVPGEGDCQLEASWAILRLGVRDALCGSTIFTFFFFLRADLYGMLLFHP